MHEFAKITGDDLYEYKSLRLQMIDENPDFFNTRLDYLKIQSSDFWQKQINDESTQRYFLNEDGKIFGMVAINLKPKLIMTKELFVLPENRGKDLGKILVKFAEDRAKEVGYKKIGLFVARKNLAAARIYAHAGYAQPKSQPIRPWYDNRPDNWLVYMEKQLPPEAFSTGRAKLFH